MANRPNKGHGRGHGARDDNEPDGPFERLRHAVDVSGKPDPDAREEAGRRLGRANAQQKRTLADYDAKFVTKPKPPKPDPQPKPPAPTDDKRHPVLVKAAPNTYGHPHPSGANGTSNDPDMMEELKGIADFRGLPLSGVSVFSPRLGSWDALFSRMAGKKAVYAALKKAGIDVVDQAMPLFPANLPGNPFADLAAGRFDDEHVRIATTMRDFDLPKLLLMRITHEWLSKSQLDSPLNDPSGGKDWSVGFQRIGSIYKAILGPCCLVDLNSIRRPGIGFMRLFPPLDSFDVLSCDSYNNAKDDKYVDDDTSWEKYATNKAPDGSPWGPKSWMGLAEEMGKLTGVMEWGPTNPYVGTDRSGIADQAVYVERMHGLFLEHAHHLALENLFNRVDDVTGSHRVWPPDDNPRSAEAYKRRFQRS